MVILVRHVAVLARPCLRARPERQRAVRRLAGAVVAERPFRIGRLLVDVTDLLPAVQDRQMHRVTRAAHLGAGHVERAPG